VFPPSLQKEHAMLKLHRIQPSDSLKERLVSFARDIRQKASRLPPGPEKDRMLRTARQADVASHLDEWANSPGLQSPK
jgi:hypothetical protein